MYAESLRMDIAKEEAKAKKENREQVCTYNYLHFINFCVVIYLRERLHCKWNRDALNTSGGVRFSIRFPDSQKVECCIASCASTQV